MGCLLLFQSSRPQSSLWGHSAIAVGLPYFTISTALNVLITTMVSIRILAHRRVIRRAAGPDFTNSVPYASIVAILIESSALYSVVAIVFIGGYASNSFVSNIFLGILAQVQVCPSCISFVACFHLTLPRYWHRFLSYFGFPNGGLGMRPLPVPPSRLCASNETHQLVATQPLDSRI